MKNEEKTILIKKIQDLARESETNRISRPEFLQKTGVSERTILKYFGSYNAFVEAAGLQPTIFPKADTPVYSDQELLNEVVRVLRLPDAKLTRIYFEQNASISTSVCERRFGGWINTLKTAINLLDADSEKTLVEKIKEYTSPAPMPTRSTKNFESDNSSHSELTQQVGSMKHSGHELLSSNSSNVYGDFINFRGLQHAPVNEQGVVFLFGMICREIGYVVEIVKPGFPDCEAKRKIRGQSGKWQRVRIEFEYHSRNFKTHGHDPDKCDVIVCWEDNWPECPIEILDLRSILQKLSSTI